MARTYEEFPKQMPACRQPHAATARVQCNCIHVHVVHPRACGARKRCIRVHAVLPRACGASACTRCLRAHAVHPRACGASACMRRAHAVHPRACGASACMRWHHEPVVFLCACGASDMGYVMSSAPPVHHSRVRHEAADGASHGSLMDAPMEPSSGTFLEWFIQP
eukprot:42494-Chlamydomonas_euryale.AAC.3